MVGLIPAIDIIMNRLKSIQVLSKYLQYTVIVISLGVLVLATSAMIFGEQVALIVIDQELNNHWSEGRISSLILGFIVAPIIVLFVLFVYWLQRLFGEFSRGAFFTADGMRCYLWLVWIKVIGFLYGVIVPLLPNMIMGGGEELDITFDVLEFFTLMLLVLIIYLLREAQVISNENKEFV